MRGLDEIRKYQKLTSYELKCMRTKETLLQAYLEPVEGEETSGEIFLYFEHCTPQVLDHSLKSCFKLT